MKKEGNEHFKNQRYAEAVKKYKKAAKMDPTVAIYYSNMAVCYEKLGVYDDFKKASQKCVELDPTMVKGYYRLATAQIQ